LPLWRRKALFVNENRSENENHSHLRKNKKPSLSRRSPIRYNDELVCFKD